MTPAETWRAPAWGRIFVGLCALFTLGALVVTVVDLVEGHAESAVGALMFAVIVGVGGVFMFGYTVRPFLTATESSLLVRNPLREYTIAWSDIERIVPGYFGLTIHRKTGGSICAVAVQKSNWASATHEDVRADRVARDLAARAAAATGAQPANAAA